MNSNRRVLHFVTGSICLYLLLSVAGTLLGFQWMPFNRVNLIADVVKEDSAILLTEKPDSNLVIIEDTPEKDFERYKEPRFVTGFSSDTASPSLNRSKVVSTGIWWQRGGVCTHHFTGVQIQADCCAQLFRRLAG